MERMPALALCLPRIYSVGTHPPTLILFESDGFQMKRADTRASPTQMVDGQPFRNWTVLQRIGGDMGIPELAVKPELPVAIGFPGGPQPTLAREVDP